MVKDLYEPRTIRLDCLRLAEQFVRSGGTGGASQSGEVIGVARVFYKFVCGDTKVTGEEEFEEVG